MNFSSDPAEFFILPPLLLLLLGGLLLGGRGLSGFGGLGLGRGLGRGQRLLGGLLGCGLLLLGVGGEGGRAARDVDVLAIVGHMLQGELGAVAGAQTHSAGPQGGRSLAHFWGEERQSGGIRGEGGEERRMKVVRQQEFESFTVTVLYQSSETKIGHKKEIKPTITINMVLEIPCVLAKLKTEGSSKNRDDENVSPAHSSVFPVCARMT